MLKKILKERSGKMKILFLINSMAGGGAERVVKTLSEHYINKGFKVTIVTLEDEKKEDYNLNEKIKKQTIGPSIMNKGLFKILSLPIQALKFKKIYLKENPDLAISFLVRSNYVNVLSGKIGKKTPIVISERTNADMRYNQKSVKGKIMRKLISILYPKSSKVIAISTGVKKSLINLNIKTEKIKVIPNPQDLRSIKELSHEPNLIEFDKNKKYIVTMGRLIESKDQKTLIQAIAHLKRNDIQLIIIGEGPKKEELKLLSKKLKITDKVFFIGWIKNPFPIIKNADIFVLPSKFEGFGNVIVEAMACQIPVISSNCSGPREILGEEEYGLLFDIGNFKQLSEKINIFIENSSKHQEYKIAGYRRSKKYDVNRIGKIYLEEMSDVQIK